MQTKGSSFLKELGFDKAQWGGLQAGGHGGEKLGAGKRESGGPWLIIFPGEEGGSSGGSLD